MSVGLGGRGRSSALQLALRDWLLRRVCWEKGVVSTSKAAAARLVKLLLFLYPRAKLRWIFSLSFLVLFLMAAAWALLERALPVGGLWTVAWAHAAIWRSEKANPLPFRTMTNALPVPCLHVTKLSSQWWNRINSPVRNTPSWPARSRPTPPLLFGMLRFKTRDNDLQRGTGV